MATIAVNKTYTSGNMSTTNNYVKFRVQIIENSYDDVANTSNVTVKVDAWRTNSGYTTNGSGSCKVTIQGTQYTQSISSSQNITYNSHTVIFNRTLSAVPHEDDGTLTLTTSTEWSINAQGSGSYTYTGTTSARTFNKALTTIQRGSTITCDSPVYMGSTQTVTVTQATAGFSHILYQVLPDSSRTEIGRYAGDKSYSWTLPDTTISDSITTTDRATYVLQCETYTANDYTGDAIITELAVTALVPTSYNPTVAVGTITEGNANIPNGWPLVIGYSKPVIPVTLTPKNGATVVKVGATIGNETVTANSSPSSLAFTNAITTANYTVYGDDSRGRSDSKSGTLSAVTYTAPALLSIDITRCDNDGTVNPVGDYVRILAKWTYDSVSGHNSATITVKKNGTTALTYNCSSNAPASPVDITIGNYISLSSSDSATFNVKLTDALENSELDQAVTKAAIPFSLYDDGTDMGATFGRMATQGGVNNWLDWGFITGTNVNLYDSSNGNVLKSLTAEQFFSPVVAWTNPDGDTTGFSTKTVTLTGHAATDYSYYEVIFNGLYTEVAYHSTGKIPIGINTSLSYLAVSSSNYRIRARGVTATTDGSGNIQLQFAQGYQWTGGSSTGSSNNICIPVQILLYG